MIFVITLSEDLYFTLLIEQFWISGHKATIIVITEQVTMAAKVSIFQLPLSLLV